MNETKSTFSGQHFKIEDLGQNRYRFTAADPSNTDTVTAHGSDQPIHFEQTLAVTKEGLNVWKVAFKKDGKILRTMTVTVSGNGETLATKGIVYKPEGSTTHYEAKSRRSGTGSGFAGTWVSTDTKFRADDEWIISSYQGDGLTFNTPAYKDVLNMKFDGKPYEETGPDVAAGSTSSGKRVNAHTLELIDKIKDKVMDHATLQVCWFSLKWREGALR